MQRIPCTNPLYWAVPAARHMHFAPPMRDLARVHVGQTPAPSPRPQAPNGRAPSARQALPSVPNVPSVAIGTDDDGKISIFWRNLLLASAVGGLVGGMAWALGSGIVNHLFFPQSPSSK